MLGARRSMRGVSLISKQICSRSDVTICMSLIKLLDLKQKLMKCLIGIQMKILGCSRGRFRGQINKRLGRDDSKMLLMVSQAILSPQPGNCLQQNSFQVKTCLMDWTGEMQLEPSQLHRDREIVDLAGHLQPQERWKQLISCRQTRHSYLQSNSSWTAPQKKAVPIVETTAATAATSTTPSSTPSRMLSSTTICTHTKWKEANVW